MRDVAVIGAGWSGLTAAAELVRQGLDVVVVEKSRGPGGRSATRRQDAFQFDHGAQYFTARGDAFARQVQAWQSLGLVSAWQPRIEVFGEKPANTTKSPAARLVAVPGMNAVLKHLASGVECNFGWQVNQLAFDQGERFWTIQSAGGEVLEACHLLITAPPSQTQALLGAEHPLAGLLGKVDMQPCWALMLGFEDKLDVPFDAAFVNHGPLSWLARNGHKPGRQGEAWVAHASPEWSTQWLEADFDQAADALLEAFIGCLPQLEHQPPSLVAAHRWRFALAASALDAGCLHHADENLVVAGDWCAGNRIEGAWTSGQAAASCISQA